ncbi:MAG: mRNA-degrading endonuclease RelE of RelBE toxin-antitoxin system [Natronomonas sp.]|jgi:mRNA-degrading endonuclease RelE of RelBE toxin-antitoxin system|uniref:type II toxin-antitoxin system RelE family toxin n=1 Tax=Natronomonas sp. TaxID=2184060 RepID=UPI003988C984
MTADYDVLLSPQVAEFLDAADEKTERIVRDTLGYLEDNPHPGEGRGDKEKLPVDGEERYRMHIGRTWTAFYDIYEDDGEVGVLEIVDIDEAHKRYGFD